MMDIKKIVALLEKKRDEAIYVASLPSNNNEFIPWRRNLEDILETAFGVDSTEYKRVHDAEVRWQGKAYWDKYGYKELVHNLHLEISSIIQKYEVLEIPFETGSTSGQDEVRTDVSKDSGTLLNDIFSASLKSPDGIDALKFRADNYQFVSEINELETSGFIERKRDLYFIRPLTLAQLAQQNPEAKNLVRACGLLFDFLRGAYQDKPGQKVRVFDLPKGTSLPEGDVRAALRIIVQTGILGSFPKDFNADDAYITPSESILNYESFEGFLQEKQEQAKRRDSQYSESKKLSYKGKKSPVEQKISFSKKAGITPLQLFDALKLHPKVSEVSRGLFKDGHYRDAIYRAFVEVNNFVKEKANSQLDGKTLMSTVFSLDNPLIKLNPLRTRTDKNEQEGFMFLFMGATQGIRNPKAHENIIQNDPYKALRYLNFASLLIETIDFWETKET